MIRSFAYNLNLLRKNGILNILIIENIENLKPIRIKVSNSEKHSHNEWILFLSTKLSLGTLRGMAKKNVCQANILHPISLEPYIESTKPFIDILPRIHLANYKIILLVRFGCIRGECARGRCVCWAYF